LFLGRELKCPIEVKWDLSPENIGGEGEGKSGVLDTGLQEFEISQ
jgi:hypothetical protein